MRKWNRLKNLLPILLALCASGSALAQGPGGYPSYGYQSYGAPAFMGGGPGSYSATGYNGLPQSFLPHPQISPFDHAFEQHFNSDGLWFKNTIDGFGPGAAPNQYYFNLSYVRTRVRGLDGIVGDSDAPTFQAEDDFPVRPSDDDDNDDVMFFNSFDPGNTKYLSRSTQHGIMANWGFENRSGWKFNLNVNWTGNRTRTYDFRNILQSRRLHWSTAQRLESSEGVFPSPHARVFGTRVVEREIIENEILNERIFDGTDSETFGVLGSTFEILDRNLFVLHALPLQDGITVGGTNQIFDMDYILRHSIETYGAGAHFASAPIIDNDRITLRTTFGGRYYEIDENLRFDGVYSGLAYEFPQQDGLDDDDDFVVDNVFEADGTDTFTQVNPSDQILIRSFMDSTVRSRLYGPEIGVEYDLGKRSGLNITGSTKVGLLLNTERLALAGDNIGNTAATDVDPGTGDVILRDLFDTTTTNGQLTQNAFTDRDGSTHVSPMFEQSLSAELPLFSRVPVLKDMWQLEHAKVKVGWTYLWLGEIADPQAPFDDLSSNPRNGIFPVVKVKRESFFQNSFNAGINWEY